MKIIVYLYTSFSLIPSPAAAIVRAVVVGLIAPATEAEIDWAAHIKVGTSPNDMAIFSCNAPNQTFELVLLPVTNVPIAPTIVAING